MLRSACSTSRKMNADLGKSALTHTARLTNSLARSQKKNGDKSAVAMLKRNEQPQRTGSTNFQRKQSRRVINDLDNVDFVPSNVNSSRQEALLYVFEDNEEVIKTIIQGRSQTMRHVSRAHRVALDWLFDRINLDPKIQIKYIDTENQLADILTKGNFTRDEWNHLLCLFNISHFSSINCLEAMSKRTQEDAGEETVTAKSKPMMNLLLTSLPLLHQKVRGKADMKVKYL